MDASNVLVELSERTQYEERLSYQATHDALTGLPNRSMLLRTLEGRLGGPGEEPEPLALLLLDLNRFKVINACFGHEYGDEVLRQLRPRLLDAVAPDCLVARMGGDEFGVVVPGADRDGARRVAKVILAAFSRPMTVQGQQFDVGASIGIALAPEHGRDATTLLRHADVAMDAAKQTRTGAAFFSRVAKFP